MLLPLASSVSVWWGGSALVSVCGGEVRPSSLSVWWGGLALRVMFTQLLAISVVTELAASRPASCAVLRY